MVKAITSLKVIMLRKTINYILKVLTAGVILLLISCMEHVTYHSCQPITNQIWCNNDTLCFQIDSLASYDNLSLEVELRTLEEYPYKNLSLIVEQVWPKLPKRTDIITLRIDNNQKQYINPIYITESVSQPIYINKASRNGKIKIYHYMKKQVLQGVNDVGIRIKF